MTSNFQKEHFGYVFVRAVAYAAGFAVYRPEVDDDSVDMGIAASNVGGGFRSPRLELQVKCTANPTWTRGDLSFRLDSKNHDDLRMQDFFVPRILIVAVIPEDEASWLHVSDEETCLRHCAYWCSLSGRKPYAGKAKEPKIRVSLPRGQRFDVEGLRQLMSRVATGDRP